MQVAGSAADADLAFSESAVRKCFRYVVPWCVLFYVLSYVDRINIGFAALSMNKDLGLTATMFGLSNTVLFVMFAAFGVPSNMVLVRLGAKRWLPRLMIGWGIASMLTVFAVGPYSLYGLRALVGIAEAGLMPGILFYLGSWFPQAHRARANSFYLASLPIALTIGGPLSGAILELNNWHGLEGWRWLFLLEGLPSLIIGVVALYALPNTPPETAWLTAAEKDSLRRRLERERGIPAEKERASVWKELLNLRVLILGLSYFCVMATTNSLAIWTPQIVNELVGKGSRPFVIGLLVSLPPLVSVFAMQAVSYHSDLVRERKWHLILSMAAVAVGWLLVLLVDRAVVKMIGLTLSFSGTYAAMALFWATAVQFLSQRNQAVGIGVISTIGLGASFVSPAVIGILRDRTHDFYSGIWFLTALIVVGMMMIVKVSQESRNPMSPT